MAGSEGTGGETHELDVDASDTAAVVPFNEPAVGRRTGTSTLSKRTCFLFQMALCTSSTWAYARVSASQSSSSVSSPEPSSII